MNRRLLTALAALLVAAGVVLGQGTAATAVATGIRFITASPLEVPYGAAWHAQLRTSFALEGSMPIPPSLGTVDVYASGIAAPIAAELPIQADGSVYVAADADAPLPPGSYELTAIFNPAQGSGLDSSQTPTPLVLGISAYSVTATLEVTERPAGDAPIIQLGLSGEYVDATGTTPAGSWSVSVLHGEEAIVDTEVAQPAGEATPVLYPIDAELAPGREYVVHAAFVPVESIAAGLEVTQAEPRPFQTRDSTLADALGAPVPYPLWLLVLSIVAPAASAAAAVVLSVRLARRRQLSPPGVEGAENADSEGQLAPWNGYSALERSTTDDRSAPEKPAL